MAAWEREGEFRTLLSKAAAKPSTSTLAELVEIALEDSKWVRSTAQSMSCELIKSGKD